MKALLSMTVLLLFYYTATAKIYYFSASVGDDTRSATQAQNSGTPWMSLQKLNTIFSSLQPGDSILFKKGDTFYGQINVTKSGSAAAPIYLGAYGTGAKPIITGLTTVSAWTSLGGDIYEGTNSAFLPSALRIVTINGINRAMGRYPNSDDALSGYLKADTFTHSPLAIYDAALDSDVKDFTNGTLVARPGRWLFSRASIIEHEDTKLHYSSPSSDTFRYPHFWIQNHPLTLDRLGEWYYNPSTKRLQVYFGSQNTPSSFTITVSTVDTLLQTKDRDYITIDGLSFEGSNMSTIVLDNSNSITIKNSNISYSGSCGIETTNSSYISIIDNLIQDVSNDGLFCRYSSGGDFTITGNTLKRIGIIPGAGYYDGNTYTGIKIDNANSIISYNNIDSTGCHGINFNRNNVKIEYNYIANYCQTLDDAGGIYSGQTTRIFDQEERYIIGNTVINGGAPINGSGSTDGSAATYGIYMDDNVNHIVIEANNVANNNKGGLYFHNTFAITARRNTVFNSGISQILMLHNKGKSPISNMHITKNIVATKLGVGQKGALLWIQTDTSQPNIDGFGVIDSNWYASPTDSVKCINHVEPDSNAYISFKQWKAWTPYDDHSSLSGKTYPNDSIAAVSIRFEYNPTGISKTIALGAFSYITPDSIRYAGSITLAAYTSVILMRDTAVTLTPLADAYVRSGAYANQNYGSADSLVVKKNTSTDSRRRTYLKFSLVGVPDISKATLRVYGANVTDADILSMSVFGINTDAWTESGITWNNAPTDSTSALSAVDVRDESRYYELDVTDYVKAQFDSDKVVSLMLYNNNAANTNAVLRFNSKEHAQNRPQLVIVTAAPVGPLADAFVRNGTYANTNYGSNDSLNVKAVPSPTGLTRNAYLKFPLSGFGKIKKAKLRIFGSNTTDATDVGVPVFGVSNDSWTENGITWNNAPAALLGKLSIDTVTNQNAYYEWDVTDFVQTQFSSDKTASFVIKDSTNKNKLLVFNSRENTNNPPQLLIDYTDSSGSFVMASLRNASEPIEYTSVHHLPDEVKLYPNPAGRNFTVVLPNNYSGDVMLQITDAVGRIHGLGRYNVSKDGHNLRVNVAGLNLKPGAYFLSLQSGVKKIKVVRFLIR